MRIHIVTAAVAAVLLSSTVAVLVPIAGMTRSAFAHDDHESFSAGEPGNPKKPARVVQITMHEGEGAMHFIPNQIEVRKGEQIKFMIRNNGELEHEFVLATEAENLKHAELMKRYPDMEHDDPNAVRIGAKKTAAILWQFTKAGTFKFDCLIPGHREAGMTGQVIVK